MAIRRTFVILAAGGFLASSALASGPHRTSSHGSHQSHQSHGVRGGHDHDGHDHGGHSYGYGGYGYGGYGYGGHGYGYGSNHSRSGFSITFGSGYGYNNTGYGYGSRYGYGSGYGYGYENSHDYTPAHRHVSVYNSYPAPVYRETRVYRSPTRYQPSRVVRVQDSGYSSGPSHATMERAWNQLGRGDSSGAIRSFASLAEASPYKALPKVGYALASAQQNDLDGAVWAMRRAFAADAEAIHYFPRDDRLLKLVQDLEYRFIERSESANANADYHFMIGALAFLRHDMERSLSAVAKAEDYRDRSKSTRALRRAVEKFHPDYADKDGY